MNIVNRWFGARREKAAKWFLRDKRGVATSHEDRKLNDWVVRDENAREYELMELAWHMSGELRRDSSINNLSSDKRPHRRTQMLKVALGVGLSFALLVAFHLPRLVPPAATYTTGVGQRRVIMLPDGSQMFLNTVTAARVEYTLLHRIILITRGEVTFDVTKNRFRPFEVQTFQGTATALGTKFDVFVRPHALEVAIVEGTVKVQAASRLDNKASVIVHTGQLAVVDAQARLSVRDADVSRIVHGRVQSLEFDNEKVADAIAEVNQYSSEPVPPVAPEILNRRISGVFHAGDTKIFANALARTFGLQVRQSKDDVILAPAEMSAEPPK